MKKFLLAATLIMFGLNMNQAFAIPASTSQGEATSSIGMQAGEMKPKPKFRRCRDARKILNRRQRAIGRARR